MGQQLVVGPSLNLTNLLNSRQVVTNRAGTVTAIPGPAVTVSGPAVTQANKVAVNVSTGNVFLLLNGRILSLSRCSNYSVLLYEFV